MLTLRQMHLSRVKGSKIYMTQMSSNDSCLFSLVHYNEKSTLNIFRPVNNYTFLCSICHLCTSHDLRHYSP